MRVLVGCKRVIDYAVKVLMFSLINSLAIHSIYMKKKY